MNFITVILYLLVCDMNWPEYSGPVHSRDVAYWAKKHLHEVKEHHEGEFGIQNV